MPQVQICRGFGDKDWEELSKRLMKDDVIQPSEDDWRRAIEIFRRRMCERFFSSIDELEKTSAPDYEEVPDDPNPDRELPTEHATPGFAIMALCCLLIDTLQFFRAGEASLTQPPGCPRPEKCASAHPSTRQAFTTFLTECISLSPQDAKSFADGIRNGIIHQAETRRWLIWRNEPESKMVERQGELWILNRTLFCKKLRTWFEEYVGRLSDPSDPERIPLRSCFVNGMDHVAKKCRET